MKIGDVAKQLGITASRIRYYDSEGMIGQVPRNSGQRELGKSNVLGLELILLAQSVGFSMEEIKLLLAEHGSESPSPETWQSFAASKQLEIRKQMADLKKMDRILDGMKDCTCPTLAECIRLYKAQDKAPKS